MKKQNLIRRGNNFKLDYSSLNPELMQAESKYKKPRLTQMI